jgi:hypothetical protein
MANGDNTSSAQAILQAAKDLPAVEARLEQLEARVRRVESFLGHTHVGEEVPAGFQEFPKAVGDLVAYSAEEEKALLAAQSAPAGKSSAPAA